jgi:hypothetical protein
MKQLPPANQIYIEAVIQKLTWEQVYDKVMPLIKAGRKAESQAYLTAARWLCKPAQPRQEDAGKH